MAAPAHLDTHIVLWLYDALIDKLSSKQIEVIESAHIFISEFVRLELYYLYEIGRIAVKPNKIIDHLVIHAEVTYSTCPLPAIMDEAIKLQWTRDPFDRIITAHASAEKAMLLTRDETILAHYRLAIR